jgi:hypothetical protein
LRLRGGEEVGEGPDQQAKHWTKLKNRSHPAKDGEFAFQREPVRKLNRSAGYHPPSRKIDLERYSQHGPA